MQRNIKRQLFKLSNLKKLSFLIFILFLFYKKYICICHPERRCLCVIIYIDVNVVSLNCTAAILSCKYMTSDDHFRSVRNNSWINRNRLTFYHRRSCCCNSVSFIFTVSSAVLYCSYPGVVICCFVSSLLSRFFLYRLIYIIFDYTLPAFKFPSCYYFVFIIFIKTHKNTLSYY